MYLGNKPRDSTSAKSLKWLFKTWHILIHIRCLKPMAYLCFQYDLWRFHDTYRYKSWMNDIMNNAIWLKPWGVHQSEPEMHLPSKHLWLSLSLSDSFSIVPNNNLLSPFLVFQNDTRSLYFDTLSVFLQREQCLTLSFVTKISLKKVY